MIARRRLIRVNEQHNTMTYILTTIAIFAAIIVINKIREHEKWHKLAAHYGVPFDKAAFVWSIRTGTYVLYQPFKNRILLVCKKKEEAFGFADVMYLIPVFVHSDELPRSAFLKRFSNLIVR